MQYKGRLVAVGSLQSDENSYTALYTLVACVELVKILFSIGGLFNWKMEHVDIKRAIIYADISSTDKIVV